MKSWFIRIVPFVPSVPENLPWRTRGFQKIDTGRVGHPPAQEFKSESGKRKII
jgi:hypothetical protein